ncbi:hypothetical protein [Porphyrobacter sp. YT40]|uniref:hypothetical protein n=1 Tax=Porphyrobacter sp. YT40 TaxID=2547601 RepID=UPI001144CF6A|nr:hypothetical protein [Porphyrobacter sp. YT40]QDH33775.1 hypothetical protein E2E27_05165 [Porphyrobacter sp. YT40]
MDFMTTGAAVPGGLIMAAALAGWMLGRWQSGHARPAQASPLGDGLIGGESGAACSPPEQTRAGAGDTAGASGVSACQHAARAERREVTEAARSLAELHDEITAYRQQEQVLATAASEGVALELAADSQRQECRYLGLIGQPTCSLPHGGHAACTHSAGCAAAMRAVQPSAGASGFTRV